HWHLLLPNLFQASITVLEGLNEPDSTLPCADRSSVPTEQPQPQPPLPLPPLTSRQVKGFAPCNNKCRNRKKFFRAIHQLRQAEETASSPLTKPKTGRIYSTSASSTLLSYVAKVDNGPFRDLWIGHYEF